MNIRTISGAALLIGVLGLTGVAGADHDDRGFGRRGSTCSAHSAYRAGSLRIDGRCFSISDCGVERQIMQAFRRSGYRAYRRGNYIFVDYRYHAPRICWTPEAYDLEIRRYGCRLKLRVVAPCGKPEPGWGGGRGHSDARAIPQPYGPAPGDIRHRRPRAVSAWVPEPPKAD